MSNSILYYPTIEFRHEDYQWLWNAALFADKIYRIVPPGYELNEPRNIRELCSTGEIGIPLSPVPYSKEASEEFSKFMDENHRKAAALPNYFSADFMIGENNRLINFDEVLSETLFSNWCLIQEELDIVHNTALYCLSRVEMPVDMKCAFLIEAFIGVGEIIQSKKSEFVLPKRKSREKSQLGLDLKYIISHYGQEIFRGEYQKDLEGFVQILVNSRNRIAHIKSKQNRKFLNGDESVLYLHKLSLMYRIILLDLLDIPLNRYKERLSNRIETINCWWADRCDQ